MLSKEIKVLITDSLSKKGVEILEKEGIEVNMDTSLKGDKLKKEIGKYDALLIRSGTQVTAGVIEKADRLKIIGRAGVGVDNVDLEAATKKGVLVMNVPAGNTISACEHTWAMILSLMRNIPQAHESLSQGKWDKKKYKGSEIYGKTLGVVGLGKIGSEVARRAGGFGMEVIAYDPFTTKEAARETGAKLVDINELLKQADIVTIHVPRNEKTKNLINKDTISKMKKTAYLINCARGGIVNEKDLAEAIKNKTIKGAALDVYEQEPAKNSPLFSLDNVIHTPHLGAATVEAQERVAVEIVKQVIDYLRNKKIKNAVNISGMEIEPSVEELANKIGILCGQMSGHLTNKVIISYKNKTKEAEDAIVRTILKGYLSQFNEGINLINSIAMAKEKGIDIIRQAKADNDIPGEIKVNLGDEIELCGGVIGEIPRLTEINGYIIDIPLTGNLLIIKNSDKPGIVGKIGTVLGEYGVNIGNMEVGRKSAGGQAVTVIGVDQEISEEVIEKLKSIDFIEDVSDIKVGP